MNKLKKLAIAYLLFNDSNIEIFYESVLEDGRKLNNIGLLLLYSDVQKSILIQNCRTRWKE